MSDSPSVYTAPNGRMLRQGDILGQVRSFELTDFNAEGQPVGRVRNYTYAITVTQDCDLEQDFRARFPENGGAESSGADKLLFAIIACGAYDAQVVKAGHHREGATKLGRDEWKLVQQNKQPRYQFLGFVPQAGKPLVADFKDFFFCSSEYLYAALDSGSSSRLACVETPWRDHVLQRFAFYLMRVGLPINFGKLIAPLLAEAVDKPQG